MWGRLRSKQLLELHQTLFSPPNIRKKAVWPRETTCIWVATIVARSKYSNRAVTYSNNKSQLINNLLPALGFALANGGSRMGHLGQMPTPPPPPPPFTKLHTRLRYSNRAVNYSNKAVTMFMRQCSLPMIL